MRQLLLTLLVLLSWTTTSPAAEVVITLPDHRLRYVMDTLRWTFGATDLTSMADAIVRLVSGGRLDSLARLEGTVTARFSNTGK